MSVPYSNLPPHKGEVDQRNYHRGIIKGSHGDEEETDRASLPPRLPSRTPSSNRIVPPMQHHQPSNKRLNQIQEVDNWSSSGYSSGSFESIPPYHHHHAYPPHQAESAYGAYQPDPYGCYQPSEVEYGEYGAWDPQQRQPMVSRDGWYYLTPPSVDGSDVYQLTPYDEWAAYGAYHGKAASSSSQYGAAAASNGAATSSRTVSSDSSSGKRKTVRFSKTVRERRHDKRETTAAMKGAEDATGAGASADQDHVYHFPRGHIETSCMCEECVLARHSIQQREYQAYYA